MLSDRVRSPSTALRAVRQQDESQDASAHRNKWRLHLAICLLPLRRPKAGVDGLYRDLLTS